MVKSATTFLEVHHASALTIDTATAVPYVSAIISTYRVFSHYVTAAMLVSQNKEMAAMLVSQTKPLGIELYFYANTFFLFQ